MKPFTLAALALLSTASTAPLIPTDLPTEFDITRFQAGCWPHSPNCYFNLNATITPTKSIGCAIIVPSGATVPDLPLTGCDDPSVSIQFVHYSTGGFGLVVTWGYEAGHNLTGRRCIDSSNVVWNYNQTPTGYVQQYVGPEWFVMGDLHDVAV